MGENPNQKQDTLKRFIADEGLVLRSGKRKWICNLKALLVIELIENKQFGNLGKVKWEKKDEGG